MEISNFTRPSSEPVNPKVENPEEAIPEIQKLEEEQEKIDIVVGTNIAEKELIQIAKIDGDLKKVVINKPPDVKVLLRTILESDFDELNELNIVPKEAVRILEEYRESEKSYIKLLNQRRARRFKLYSEYKEAINKLDPKSPNYFDSFKKEMFDFVSRFVTVRSVSLIIALLLVSGYLGFVGGVLVLLGGKN
jgi:hypothetical protein